MANSTLAMQDRRVIENAVIVTCQKVLDQVLQRRERHRKLQSQITALGCKLGFESRKEYVLAHYQEGRVGVLDVV